MVPNPTLSAKHTVLVLVPNGAGMVFTVVALPIFIGEVTFCLWLLFKELDEERWNQMASQESAR